MLLGASGLGPSLSHPILGLVRSIHLVSRSIHLESKGHDIVCLKTPAEALATGRVGLPASECARKEALVCKKVPQNGNLLPINRSPSGHSLLYQVSLSWSNSGGTQAAKGTVGGIIVKGSKTRKPNSRRPRMVS